MQGKASLPLHPIPTPPRIKKCQGCARSKLSGMLPAAQLAEIDRKLLKRGSFHAGIKVMLSCMIGVGVTYRTGNHLLNKTPGDDHLRGFLIIRFKLSARNSRPGLPMRSRNKRNSPNPHPVSCGTRGKSASTPRHKTDKM